MSVIPGLLSELPDAAVQAWALNPECLRKPRQCEGTREPLLGALFLKAQSETHGITEGINHFEDNYQNTKCVT